MHLLVNYESQCEQQKLIDYQYIFICRTYIVLKFCFKRSIKKFKKCLCQEFVWNTNNKMILCQCRAILYKLNCF